MSWGFGTSGHQGGAYQSMVGPGYSYAVITSSTDPIGDTPEGRCSLAGDRRCSKDHAHGSERRPSRDHSHCRHHDHSHEHCHDHCHDHKHRHGRSREHTRASGEARRSREHTLSGSSNRDSSEMTRPSQSRDRAGTDRFGSFASGLTLPKSQLGKGALEMTDVESGSVSKAARPTTVSRKSTMRSRGNTYNSVRRRSGSAASTTSVAALPPMTIRKKSSNIPFGRTMPRGTTRTEGTVDLNKAVYMDAQRKTNKEKGRSKGYKAKGGSF